MHVRNEFVHENVTDTERVCTRFCFFFISTISSSTKPTNQLFVFSQVLKSMHLESRKILWMAEEWKGKTSFGIFLNKILLKKKYYSTTVKRHMGRRLKPLRISSEDEVKHQASLCCRLRPLLMCVHRVDHCSHTSLSKFAVHNSGFRNRRCWIEDSQKPSLFFNWSIEGWGE